jgi:hypothetical protein
MKHSIRRIVLLSAVLALIGALIISSAAFAAPGGSQVRAGAYSQNGNTYGPGDGTGPIGGGQFGPGPLGKCVDLNQNGICDCLER